MIDLTICTEQAQDIPAIHQLTIAAFKNAPHTDHTEQFVVDALRRAGALSGSLVAEKDQQIIGHVALSPVKISDGSQNWYGLGPISVMPEYRGLGIGSQLMQAAIAFLKEQQAAGCVLLGDPNYYQRFGFKVLPQLSYPHAPAEFFQALPLNDNAASGTVDYHAAFNATC